MDKRKYFIDLQSILLGICVIATTMFENFYSNGGKRFDVVNMYGDTVQLYGDGIYKYSSTLNVSNYFGANMFAMITAIFLILLTLWKNKLLWAEILRTSEIVTLVYYCACSLFGTPMNPLYLLNTLCFGLSIFTSFMAVKNLFNRIEIPKALKEKSMKGTVIFLIISGTLTALIWLFSIIPITLSGDYGSLLGIQTTEVTFGIDLSITCPLLILCGIWIFQKKDKGYKMAPLLLNLLIGVAIMVILQRAYCIKLGVEISIQALIGFIISFVVLGVIALYLFVKLTLQLEKLNRKHLL